MGAFAAWVMASDSRAAEGLAGLGDVPVEELDGTVEGAVMRFRPWDQLGPSSDSDAADPARSSTPPTRSLGLPAPQLSAAAALHRTCSDPQPHPSHRVTARV
jgi:hypothetical protein